MFRKFILKFNGSIFCLIFNFRSIVLNKKVRFSFDKKNSLYFVKEGSRKLAFFHKKQALYAYSNGIFMRIQTIKKDYLLENINFKKSDVIIDIGANVGDLYQYLNSLKINNLIYYAFEPSALEYKCLKLNTKGKFFKMGLWNKKTLLNFFSASETADSSFIEPKGYDNVSKKLVNRLDNVVRKKKIKLLKLEAEGAEIEVILGAKNILKNIEYISADLGYERGKLEKSTLIPVTNFLLKNNYELVDFNIDRVVALYKNTKQNKNLN